MPTVAFVPIRQEQREYLNRLAESHVISEACTESEA